MPTEKRELGPSGILQPWVAELGLRHQGVLLTAVRGCDTVERHDPVKLVSRAYRGEILQTHCANPEDAKSFIELCDTATLIARLGKVASNHDHYPHHYIMHLIHASEIVGYCGPNFRQAPWRAFYFSMCSKLHANPETAEEMNRRLNADEESFASNQ